FLDQLAIEPGQQIAAPYEVRVARSFLREVDPPEIRADDAPGVVPHSIRGMKGRVGRHQVGEVSADRVHRQPDSPEVAMRVARPLHDGAHRTRSRVDDRGAAEARRDLTKRELDAGLLVLS